MSSVLLRVDAIKKVFKTKSGVLEALKGVSFDLYEGEVFGLLGANGAGKTTLSSILATLHPPTSGNIFLNGVSICNDIAGYRDKLGFCPQSPNVNEKLTIKEQLFFAGYFYGLDKHQVKDRYKLVVDKFGLTQYVNEKPSVLSGGYKQRLMLARTLMHRPKFVIFDEPTVGLDPHIRRNLWDLILELKKDGATILLTTHYLDEAEALSDRVCILERGKIRVIDKPDNLKALYGSAKLEDVFIKLMQEETQ